MKATAQRWALRVLAAWVLLSAATHATSLCSSLCAAGQTAEGTASPVLVVVESISRTVPQAYRALALAPVLSSVFRGPSSLIVSC